ncbi:MAG: DNA pilot protein [Microviridae sp.]|nr:MAG: DNA pilot protein [Microviridae sp.]
MSGLFGSLLAGGMNFASSYLGYEGQKDANETSQQISTDQMNFNSVEAQKTRDYQERMRGTQYQTTVNDLRAAGLNPMLAYTNGGSGTPGGATASYGSIPHIGNKMESAMNSSAMAATIRNTWAQTDKTEADADLSRALATKAEADTTQSTASAGNLTQQTENLKEQVTQIRQNVHLQYQQGNTEFDKQSLLRAQQELALIEKKLTEKKIPLTEAQTELTKITKTLNALDIPEAENRAGSQGSWWMRNVAPYVDSAGKATNSATGAIRTLKGR